MIIKSLQKNPKLSLDKHFFPLSQLNAISTLHSYLGFKEKEFLTNGFAYANFNHCSLIWHFCSTKFVRETEQIQIRSLRILYNDFDSDSKTFLDKSGKCAIEVKRLRTLGLEFFKTLNNTNPAFMEEIFKNNIRVNIQKAAKYGDKSLRMLGPHILNSLPEQKQKLTSWNSEKI